ncbi:thiamine phosphate synthase [soil metagenome]
MLKLPKLYLITPEPTDTDVFLTQLQRCLQQGIKLVQLRAKSVSYLYYSMLATKVMKLCEQYQALLILNGEVITLPLAGLHFSSAQLWVTEAVTTKKRLLSASCHNAEELLHAEKIGVDFVTLSPVLSTATHPDATPLGWEKFTELAQLVDIPVYALGGVKPANLALAQQCGAWGIAAIRGIWGD